MSACTVYHINSCAKHVVGFLTISNFAVCFRDSNTLFRGNSVATKSVDEFMKHAGMYYLHDTIKCLVDEVRLWHFRLLKIYIDYVILCVSMH